MDILKSDPGLAEAMGLRDAATAQRKFWKSLRQEEVDTLDFTSMSVAAHMRLLSS